LAADREDRGSASAIPEPISKEVWRDWQISFWKLKWFGQGNVPVVTARSAMCTNENTTVKHLLSRDGMVWAISSTVR
jgi:hypothetical protein